MKNMKIKMAIVAVVAAVAGYGIYQNQIKEVLSDLTLANVEALARYELPDVVIECGSYENKGRCWRQTGCEPVYTPFGFFRETSCDEATGNPSDVCYEGLPC